MATITSARSLYFTWPDDFRPDFFNDFAIAVRETAPTAAAATPFTKLSRSKSIQPILSLDRQGPKPPPKKTKSVHFADSKGLALVSVLTFNVEKELQEEFSRYVSLHRPDKGQTTTSGDPKPSNLHEGLTRARTKPEPKEMQLLSAKKIAKRVDSQKVCLEKTEVLESTIRGTVCVHNLAYEKSVSVRYTMDNWKSEQNTEAKFLNSNMDKIDRFVFEIPVPRESLGNSKNCKVQFAVSYSVLGNSFWDNNNGFNYHVLVA